MVNNYMLKSRNLFLILAVHSFLPIRLFLLRKVILIKFYLLTVNQIPCLQKEEDHATQELTGGGDAVLFHEGGDTVRTDSVRADAHQTLPAEVLQRAALTSSTRSAIRPRLSGIWYPEPSSSVPTSSSAAAVSIPSTLMRWAAAVSFRNTYW